jgi:hypothetical protein
MSEAANISADSDGEISVAFGPGLCSDIPSLPLVSEAQRCRLQCLLYLALFGRMSSRVLAKAANRDLDGNGASFHHNETRRSDQARRLSIRRQP